MRESRTIMKNGKTLVIRLHEESGFSAEVVELDGRTVPWVDGVETLMQLFYRLIDKGCFTESEESIYLYSKELIYLYSKAIDDLGLA